MNCYLCLTEAGSHHQPAYALCQKCMAGICKEHLVEMETVSLTGYAPQPHFLCQRCHQLIYAPTTSAPLPDKHRGKKEMAAFSWRSWWQQLRQSYKRRSTPALPTPQEALEAVETFLKQQRN